MHAVERARRIQGEPCGRGQYPDVPIPVTKADRTFEDLDSSFSSTTSVGTITTATRTILSREFFSGFCSGKIPDPPVPTASKSGDNAKTIREQSSITPLRLYHTAVFRHKGSTICASVPSTVMLRSELRSSTNTMTGHSSFVSINSPLKNHIPRRRLVDQHERLPQQEPHEQSSAESLNPQLHCEIHRNLGFSSPLGAPEESIDETGSSDDPTSPSYPRLYLPVCRIPITTLQRPSIHL